MHYPNRAVSICGSNRLGQPLSILVYQMDGWGWTVVLTASIILLLSLVVLTPLYGMGQCSLLLPHHASVHIYHSPVGVFEFDKFANGSKAVMDAVVMATEKGATSIIG